MNGAAGKFIGYGLGDSGPDVVKVQRRVIWAYPENSKARQLGVTESGNYDLATEQAVRNIQDYLNRTEPKAAKLGVGERYGVADYATRVRIKAYIPPRLGSRYKIQGVGGVRSDAYLMPPDAPCFNKATAGFAREGVRLTRELGGGPVIDIGYSMGAKSARDYEVALPAELRDSVKLSIQFGDPSMPADGSLLGDDPGQGISRQPHPDYIRDRFYSYSIEGDWYPRATADLLFYLFEIISRAELTLEFATWLFTQWPTLPFKKLAGVADSSDPLAGILSGLAGVMTDGPTNVIGVLLNPFAILAMLPDLIDLLVDALKFAMSQAHGKYMDPAEANWDGMTAVDHAVKTIREKCPNGATLLLFPGSWAQWNQGFQFDVALRLQ
ncbi:MULTISPECIES: cutinase [unclassified Mycobacterium]|uniref:peptidoglycan-binding domain-containing protein n=1 Tax=unclassified Mycobacterium TaxID=2642494 RepID=UPI0029C83872|nr:MULTISPECIES: cutinase [unclassified Mycobacterium]